MGSSDRNKRYYAKNRERLLARAKKHYHDNHERYLAYNRAYWKTYYVENKERLLAKKRGDPKPPKERKIQVKKVKPVVVIADTTPVQEDRPEWYPLPIRYEFGNFWVSFP